MIDRRGFLAAGVVAALCASVRPAFAAARFEPVVTRLRDFVAQEKLPFASLRIAQHGEVLEEVHLSGMEKIGPGSIFRIYSMTKPVVAAGVVLLLEDGKLALEDPVAKYVPEFSDLKVVAGSIDTLVPARTMTVAHLLTHSSGLANSWGGADVAPLYRDAGLVAAAWMYDPEIGGLAGFAKRLGALPLQFQPGSDWLYGYGLDIAGLVIERVSGERLGDFLRKRIFEPLGMTDTAFHVPEAKAPRLAGLYAAGADGLRRADDAAQRTPLSKPFADGGSAGLVSTLEDYGRFADMLANGGKRGTERVMKSDCVRLMTTAYGTQDALQASLWKFGRYPVGSVAQALGGVVRLDDRSGPGSRGEYAWGGAAGTGFFAAPDPGLSMTLMTQLMPVTAVPARDALRPMIYAALASAD